MCDTFKKKKNEASQISWTQTDTSYFGHIFFSKDPDRSGHELGGLRANQLTEMAPALSAH